MHGLVTDVCLKRKVRDYVDVARGDEGRFKIYIQSGGDALNSLHKRAYEAQGMKSTGTKQARGDVDKARAWMCENFYDIRVFGAVMSTGVNAGQVRGPMQLTFARSIEAVTPLDITITRSAITRPEDADVVVTEEIGESGKGKQTEMGRKAIVPYGLYKAHGFFNPHFAQSTGASSEDLELFWAALQGMWDLDRSAARGMMTCRGLYVFSHENKLGNAPAHRLFERVQVKPVPREMAARRFEDYEVTVDEADLPTGVTLTRLEG